MVTQPVDDTSQEGLAEGQGGLAGTVIYDETSESQRELERQALGGEDPQSEPPVEEPVAEPEPVAEETPEPQAQPEPQPQAQTPEPQAQPEAEPAPEPQTRVFTQDEVSKMQPAWMKQIQEAKTEAQQAAERLSGYDLNAKVEAELRKQELELSQQYGPEDASKIVRTQSNMDMIRRVQQTEQQLARAETEKQQAAEAAELNAKGTVAQNFMQQFNLPAEDFEVLLATSSPSAMQTLAQRLARQAQAQAEVEKRQIVPPETQKTQLSAGISAGSGVETDTQRSSRIMAKPSWEWTREEHQYMRRKAGS